MQSISDRFELAATDLSNHLGCVHLTQLERKAALKEITKPKWYDPSLEALVQRGKEHEDAYVAFLSKKGLIVKNLNGQPLEKVIEAMSNGVDIIVQALLQDRQWMGYADILIKVPGQSKFGNWMYEVQDTKLAHTTRAATILQLCLYTDLLSVAQEAIPQQMYVVKPGDDFPTETFRFPDFQAYYRLAKKGFEEIMNGSALPTYPEPVEHCAICRWWSLCDKKRHDDDYLSLVAGIGTLHIKELQKQKINTLESFATTETFQVPQRGNKQTYLRKQQQAKVQLEGRVKNTLVYELLPFEKDRGLNRLPNPDRGDIYFDIEGDAFFPNGGLEYILGYAFRDKDLLYKSHWAITRIEEKGAFESFMKFVVDRCKKYPNLHIYHFASYEPSAIKRLASTHATYELEVDELLREERFVDLHAIFKEAMLASVEHYSLKSLEKLTKYTRKVDLREASIARKNVECALELNEFKSLAKETIELVGWYNEDDCLATEALHQWLEDLRTMLESEGHPFKRPTIKEPESSEDLKRLESRSRALFTDLVKNLPEDKTQWTQEHHAKWLLAHQVEYFRREDKSAWWEYFRVHTMEYEELLGERKAVTGLKFLMALPLKPKEKTPIHRYSYPAQEIGLAVGDNLVECNAEDEKGKLIKSLGKVSAISIENYTIDIKKTEELKDVHPFAVHVFDRIDPEALWIALMDIAFMIDRDGLSHSMTNHAAKDLLMKRDPILNNDQSGAFVLAGEDSVKAAIRIALNLNRSILPIQGPPGAGKTYIGAKMIIELVKAKKKVGVTAISHRVITTLFEKVKELSSGAQIEFAHKVTAKNDYMPDWVQQITDSKKIASAIEEGKVIGGTAWLWAKLKVDEPIDYLFIDEAGQMSLSQAIAVSGAAKNLILLGDPQQLEQPQRGAHPEDSDIAALTYLLDGKQTIPDGRGLFLGITRRIHPAISKFTSEIFYEGKLESAPGLENQVISGGTLFDGAGLFFVPTEHTGNQNQSDEEVEMVAKVVAHLLSIGKWTDSQNKISSLKMSDILIVAPYNAQVAALIEKLPGLQIGTVDKFQGKEAPVVIYSMTSSSVQDAPRGMSFLYSPNRLNVATSRAKSACILVAAPKVLEPECKSIEQMKWANALCRFKELSKTIII